MLLKITPIEIILEDTFEIGLPTIIQKNNTQKSVSPNQINAFHKPQTLQLLPL